MNNCIFCNINTDYLKKKFTICDCKFNCHLECWDNYLIKKFHCPICYKNTIKLQIIIPKEDENGIVIKNKKKYYHNKKILLTFYIIFVIIIFYKFFNI